MHSVFYGQAPSYISEIVTPVTHLPGRAHLRSAKTLVTEWQIKSTIWRTQVSTHKTVHKLVDGYSINENFCPPKVVWPNIIMHRGAINGDRAFVYNVKAHNADDFGI